MSGSVGAGGFAQSSGELKGLRDKPGGGHGLWVIRTLGFVGAGGVVLLDGGL